jgi:hypothetical protein
MSKEPKLPVELPRYNEDVLAIVQHFHTKSKRSVVLHSVDESDCSWRISDDNSELAYEWDVISWEYVSDP